MIKARAYRQKQRAEWVKIAQQTVWILNAFRGKRGRRLRVEDLIGPEEPGTNKETPRKKTTPEETKALMNDLLEQFGHR